LKYKISFLSKSKMTSSSRTRPALGTMSNTQLLNEIQGNATQLRMYSEGVKLPNVGVGAELATRIEQASLLIHNTLVDEITVARKALEECEMTGARVKATLLDRIQEAEASITKLEHGFEGLQTELGLKTGEADRLTILCDEQDAQLRELTNRLYDRGRRIERLETELDELHNMHEALQINTRRLAEASEQVRLDLERAGQALAERDIVINNYQIRLENCRTERGILENRYLREQLITRRLTRQRLALRIANRQLQIRLMNPPPAIEPVRQIWLLL
jgi:chromosome segregation ATPase